MVRTSGFHPGNRGSIPLGVTTKIRIQVTFSLPVTEDAYFCLRMYYVLTMKYQIQVSFIGAGKIGSALAKLVSQSGAHVEQWDADASKVLHQKKLEHVVEKADVLFLCVPSWILRKAMEPMMPHLNKKTVCVFVSKGIEEKTKFFMNDFAKSLLPKGQPFVLLSGPMLAEELIDHHGGAACVGTKSIADFHKIESLFSCEDLRLTFAPDTKSVAIAGVLKNVYAIALGIAIGLKWGDNRKGWLCSDAIQEMIAIMIALKADPSYVLSQAGLGDFIATGMSEYSSNHSLGRELVEGVDSDRKSEGYQALPSLVKMLSAKTLATLPILCTLDRVTKKSGGEKNAKMAFENLFCE